MKITQREFMEAMTGNLTHFVGIVKFHDLAYFTLFLDEAIQNWKREGVIIEKRSCVARSKDLVFSGGSRLDLTGMEFYKVIGNCYTLYVCLKKWFDEWDKVERTKSMLYVVYN